jgi:hypothetical protein
MKTEKIKVRDESKLKLIKTLFNNKLTEIYSELNKDQIIKIFSEYLKDDDLENFKKNIDNLNEDILEKIYSRIKKYNKTVLKFISKIIIEERVLKNNEIRIDETERNEKLLMNVNEKIQNLRLTYQNVNKINIESGN